MYPPHVKTTDLTRFTPKVISVLGVSCVGKSTYCRDLMSEMGGIGEEPPVYVQVGKFLRSMFGEQFFARFPEAGSPEVVDNLIKMVLTEAFRIAEKYHKNVILDGFPRNERQVNWLLNSSYAQNISCTFDFIFLHCNKDVLSERTMMRISGSGNIEGERALIQKRREYEVYQIVELQKVLAIAKERLKSKISIDHVEY